MRHLLVKIDQAANKEFISQNGDISIKHGGEQYILGPDMGSNNQGNQSKKNARALGALFQGGFIEFTLPIILRFALGKPFGVLWASVISSIPIILSFLYSTIILKTFPPFSLIMFASIYVGLGFELGFEDERLKEMDSTAICAALGLLMIFTIPFKKPFLYYLSKPFTTSGDERKARAFEDNWSNPLMRGPNRILSLVWGIGLFIIAGLNAAVVFLIPENHKIWVELASKVVTVGCVVFLVVFCVRYRISKARKFSNSQNQEMPLYQ